MEPLGPEALEWILSWDDGLHRSVALHHAAIHNRPGLYGDDPRRPTSVVWIRPGDAQWEAFGAGFAEPAVRWLATQPGPIALLAPPAWEVAVQERAERLDRGFIQTWLRPDPPRTFGAGKSRAGAKTGTAEPLPARVPASTRVATRRLTLEDEAAFLESAPSWALRAWGSYDQLMTHGAAFGVPGQGGQLASVSWVFQTDHYCDAIGVATPERYQRLGLGRAVCSELVEHILHDRRKYPLWTTTPGNAPSLALARTLGFSAQVTETLLCWTPRAVLV